MISSTAKSEAQRRKKTFSEFWLKKQLPLPMKTESTTNSLPMNLRLKVAMPMNACLNVTTILTDEDDATDVSTRQDSQIQQAAEKLTRPISFVSRISLPFWLNRGRGNAILKLVILR
jgi:hypothetical protein